MNFSFLPLRRNTKNILGAILALVILYWVGYYFVGKPFVPDNFNGAREQSASMAKEIVVLTEESIQSLDKIAVQDRQYNFKAALVLVRAELEKSNSLKLKMLDLTGGLSEMIQATSGITPAKARNLAISAINDEVFLVTTYLKDYVSLLNGLLKTLDYKFSGDINYKADDVQTLIKNMNQKAQEINDLNNSFNKKMQEFDELVK
ncbi:MAG: hypothetical protein Q7S73_00450 [bacterium]|nr:hypothetical protein [bacterium]